MSLGSDPGLRIGLVGRNLAEMAAEIVMPAVRAADQRGRQHLDGARAIEARQRILRTHHQRGGAIADRRAHRARQRPGDQLVVQNFIDRHVMAILRQRIHRRVIVALGRRRRDLARRRAVQAHVLARERGIDVHEHAVLTGVGLRLGRQRQPFAEAEQHLLAAVHVVDVPAAEECLEHQVLLVGIEHFFRADHERDLAKPGLDLRKRLIEPGRT